MNLRMIAWILCLVTMDSFSQGYSGNFEVSSNNRVYHFTLVDGKLKNPVYTIIEGTEYIDMMYLVDSAVLSGVDSLMTVHQKDSLLKQFLSHFSGTSAQYNKKGIIIAASYYPQPTDLDDIKIHSSADQRMNFYRNGAPYAQFYQKNGWPSRSVVYFTRDGEIEKITDLSQYPPGEEVAIQNPYDFKLRKETIKIIIQ